MKRCALLIPLATLSVTCFAASLPADQVEFFEKKIRPVLIAECYECHADTKQKGGLALNSREALMQGGESGPAVVPGDPETSLLISSLRHVDPELKMPKKAPKLDDAVINDFVAWVQMGAPDPRLVPDKAAAADNATWTETFAARRQWWCFQPIRNPAPPTPKDRAWSEHPIDRFLLAAMETRGLSPSADADSRTLVRRLSFALTGLPPDPQEVQTFVAQAAGNQGAAVVDRTDQLLASLAFGERWARHWMDLARYAETYGSEHDYLNPHAWRYRDYLIRAFNADLPYDRFVQEQIAGDLLEPRWDPELGTNEALLGTAWHRMIESYATPVDVKREEATIVDWQIEALGKTFLGLTIQCARCHDHKFDPVSDDDFYALYGVFASTRPTLSILDAPEKLTAQDAALAKVKKELRSALAARWKVATEPAKMEAPLRRDAKDTLKPVRELFGKQDFASAWQGLRERSLREAEENPTTVLFADFTREDLAGWRVSGPGLPAKPSAPGLLSLGVGEDMVRAIQPAGVYSDEVSERHGGSFRSPEFVIEKRAVSVLANGTGKARLRLVIENFQNDLLLFSAVNPDLNSPAPRWFTMPIKEQWLGRRARVELLTRDDKTCVGHTMDQEAWAKTDGRSAFGVQRVVFHDGSPPPPPSPLPIALWKADLGSWNEFIDHFSSVTQAALRAWEEGRARDEDARLLQALLEGGVLPNKAASDDDAAASLIARFRDLETTMVLPTRAPGVVDDASGYDSPLFPRGDHAEPSTPVPRRFPEVLGGAPLGGAGSGRLELARELTRRDNPLTARVMANRVWQHLTGRGLVATPDNFGKMGEKPTHPELLDHLATRFMEDGWSVKRLIKYIVTSRAWQLSAQPTPGAVDLDPPNDLLSHANVRRLEAEAIRDEMLAVAGNLRRGHSGPGVRPFYRAQIDPDKQPPAGPIDGGGRRSVYLEARRLFPSEFLAIFDAPKPNIFTGSRSETNVPAQSLTLLNDPFVQHQAKIWAERIAADGESSEQRITRCYLEALARPPEPEELVAALRFIAERPKEPWRDLAHSLFNMKEFIYLR